MTMAANRILTGPPLKVYVAPAGTPPPHGFAKDPTEGDFWALVEDGLISEEGVTVQATYENGEITVVNSVFPIAAYRTAQTHSISFRTIDMDIGRQSSATEAATGLAQFLDANITRIDDDPGSPTINVDAVRPRGLSANKTFALLLRGRTNLNVDSSAAGINANLRTAVIPRQSDDDSDDVEWYYPVCYVERGEFGTTAKGQPGGIDVSFKALRPTDGTAIAEYRWADKLIYNLEFLGAVPPFTMAARDAALEATTGIKFNIATDGTNGGTVTAIAGRFLANGNINGPRRTIGTATADGTNGQELTINFSATDIRNRVNATPAGGMVRLYLDYGLWGTANSHLLAEIKIT